jgi:AraC-like DNA-binding protein
MIKASFESLQLLKGNSFLVRRFNEKSFSAPYHFHPELELTLILKGEGTRFAGSSMAPFAEGDLVLLGSNLPHCWKSENIKAGINASSLVIQFTYDFLGAGFLSKTEMQGIEQLLQRSRCGIRFFDQAASHTKESLLLLEKEQDPFLKLLLFLKILHYLSLSKQFQVLNKADAVVAHSSSEQKRINNIVAYIVENFRSEIVLHEVAAIAGMSPTSFCKYYKRMTRKTFFEYVLEYRVNYATQQLVDTDKPVAHIGFESGFGDVSHFYKTFKSKKKLSPLQYRKKFMKEVG